MGGWLSLDPFEGVAGSPMSLNGYAWVEGMVINAVDPSGLCLTGLDSDCNYCLYASPGAGITSCLANCQRGSRLDAALDYLAKNYHGFRFDDSLPNGNTEQSQCGAPSHPNRRGVEDFVRLSDEVARITNNNLRDYLFVMNTILLRYESAGDLSVMFSAATSQTHYNSFCIGSEDLSRDYNDNTTNQISTHIWVAIATTASPDASQNFTSRSGIFGALVHEIYEEGGSWVDFVATWSGLILGSRLKNGNISPSQFGDVFHTTFTNPFSNTIPGSISMAEMEIRWPMRQAHEWASENSPQSLWGIADRIVEIMFSNDGVVHT